MTYNWQQKDWPHFQYDLTTIHESLLMISEKSGLIRGKLAHLSPELQTEAMIDLMVEEAVKTSQIEGEFINRPDVRSSIKKKLGLLTGSPKIHDKRAQGVADLMVNVRNTFAKKLTKNTLFEWHFMLFASSLNPNLLVGGWRTDIEPMQIISNRNGRSVVHFEAPPANLINKEMKRFIDWFNHSAPNVPNTGISFAPVRAAIAHLYFEGIHPFDDGNGRIGRAIAEKALSQGFGYPVSFGLSHAIEANKKEYYSALHAASKSNEITNWIDYFVRMILAAQINVENQINFILKKSKIFDMFADQLNERQMKVIRRMLQAGSKGFEGGMSARKYMKITGVSKATATRDLQHLYALKIFKQIGGGRSVNYELNMDENF